MGQSEPPSGARDALDVGFLLNGRRIAIAVWSGSDFDNKGFLEMVVKPAEAVKQFFSEHGELRHFCGSSRWSQKVVILYTRNHIMWGLPKQ